MDKTYHIITYGCQMNVHESEKLAGILVDCGYTSVQNYEDADLILLNTCCIRETAESHILGNLGIIKKLKEKKPSLIVAVCGCMTQQQDAAEKLKKRCPFINIIFGTHNIHKFGEYLSSLKSEKSIIEIYKREQEIVENLPLFRTSGLNAWVNIMYGCDNFCSYCIVPYVRGRERSREPQLIYEDVKKLTEEGYKEITLLGQNVNSYGSGGVNFSKLLEKLASIDGKFRIRFMTSHPKDLSEDVVKTIAGNQNISKFIHLPVQAGNDRILALMNRKYTSKDYLNKIDMIRKYIPSAGLSTDLMVGFPSESDAEFEDSVRILEEVGFNNVYTFMYSRRSGTAADKMPEQIDLKTKKARIKKLIETQFEIGKKISGAMVGKEVEVLCETFKNGKVSGKTDCNKIVSFSSKEDLYSNFEKVKITHNKNTNLTGELVR